MSDEYFCVTLPATMMLIFGIANEILEIGQVSMKTLDILLFSNTWIVVHVNALLISRVFV